jgi:hypothetical protein
MKRSKLLSTSILIALALLLSAANAEQPSPRPTIDRSTPLAQERKNHPTQTETDSIQPSPTLESTSSKPTARSQDEKNAAREHRQNPSGEPPKESQPRDWLQIFFNFWLTVATIALAIFTWKLVGVTRDVHRATEKGTEVANENVKAARVSAEAAKAQLEFTKLANKQNLEIGSQAVQAAKENARAAALGVKSNRPYLLVEKGQLKGVVDRKNAGSDTSDSDETDIVSLISDMMRNAERLKEPVKFLPQAVMTFRNYGKGAALIKTFVGTIAAVEQMPSQKDFSKCRSLAIQREALGPNDTFVDGNLYSAEFTANRSQISAIENGTRTLLVYGRIVYSDVTGSEEYETGFFWTFRPPKVMNLSGLAPPGLEPTIPSSFSSDPDRSYHT